VELFELREAVIVFTAFRRGPSVDCRQLCSGLRAAGFYYLTRKIINGPFEMSAFSSSSEQNVWPLADFSPKGLDAGLQRHFHSVHFGINGALIRDVL
jgi:hypothetical protein